MNDNYSACFKFESDYDDKNRSEKMKENEKCPEITAIVVMTNCLVDFVYPCWVIGQKNLNPRPEPASRQPGILIML